MKIGFDIGGVISKDPYTFQDLMLSLSDTPYFNDLFIITDQHPKDKVIQVLKDNHFEFINPDNVYCANYEKYGNMAKVILIKELGLDIFFDDFDGYLQWDSSFGPQPLLLKVMPDAYKPYWHENWKQEGGDFGRRKYDKVCN